MADLHYLTLSEASDALRARRVSPVELCRALLDRIERVDPALRAYTTVTAELALEQAQRAEDEVSRGERRGPLHGVPIALKDLCDTAGIRTTAGGVPTLTLPCGFRADHVPLAVQLVAAPFREGTVLRAAHAYEQVTEWHERHPDL